MTVTSPKTIESAKIKMLEQERRVDPEPAWMQTDWYRDMLVHIDEIEEDFECSTIPWEEAEEEMGRYV